MKAMIVENHKGCWRSIAEYYRSRIVSGEFPVGSSLPTTREIAAQFGTSIFSVQSALSALAHEGIILRLPRHGTKVISNTGKLNIVAILVFISGKISINNYLNVLISEIALDLRNQGCEPIILLEDSDEIGVIAGLKKKIKALQVKGIIHFATKPELSAKLKSINIPLVTFDLAALSKTSTTVKVEQFPELGIKALANAGCKRIGIISFLHDNGTNKCSWHRFFRPTPKVLSRKYKIQIPEELICTTPDYVPYPNDKLGRYAYDSLHRLWSSPNRPDGLLVYPDDLIPGVIAALHELRIRIPEDLHLVLHRNYGIPFFVPFQYTAIEQDIQTAAKNFVDMMINVFNGGKSKVINIAYNAIHVSDEQ